MILRYGYGRYTGTSERFAYGGAKKLGHGTEYKYPHSYENHYVKQQYLPNNIRDTKYYDFGDNKTEQSAKVYWDRIKKGN